MKTAAQPIDVSILRSMRSSRGASVFSPRHFDGVGSPDAIRQALSRLVKAGKIRRIRRGLYDLPRQHPIIGQTAPDIMATVRALMDGSHAQWQFSGAYAANALGLSDQVPAKIDSDKWRAAPSVAGKVDASISPRRAAQLAGCRSARRIG